MARLKLSHLKKIKEKLIRIHPGAGLIIQKTVGDPVQEGDLLAEMHFPASCGAENLLKEIRNSFVVTDYPPSFIPFIAEKIRGNF